MIVVTIKLKLIFFMKFMVETFQNGSMTRLHSANTPNTIYQ